MTRGRPYSMRWVWPYPHCEVNPCSCARAWSQFPHWKIIAFDQATPGIPHDGTQVSTHSARPPAEPPPKTSITPPGSLYDIITRPASPTSITADLDCLSGLASDQRNFNMFSPPQGTVAHIYSRPRIFGLRQDSTSTVVAQLIDSGANIWSCQHRGYPTSVNPKKVLSQINSSRELLTRSALQ
jgi:hypothetical protein